MSKLSLADIHCDTAYEMFKNKVSFKSNSLAISTDKADIFEQYFQVMAIWSDNKLDNNSAYIRFFEIAEYLQHSLKNEKNVAFLSSQGLTHKNILLLSLEDARILNNDIDRLNKLFLAGVRIITPLWKGTTCIGGSYDTNVGLSPFGKEVIKRCIELNIIPDISHASQRSADDIFEICNGQIPVIASHSNAYSVYPHPRNLTNELFNKTKNSGGIVGICLCADHLSDKGVNTPIKAVLNHIEHYLSLGGEDTVCFGCDFDGAVTPLTINNISSLPYIAEEMAKLNFKEGLIRKIFFENAKNFVLNNTNYNIP